MINSRTTNSATLVWLCVAASVRGWTHQLPSRTPLRLHHRHGRQHDAHNLCSNHQLRQCTLVLRQPTSLRSTSTTADISAELASILDNVDEKSLPLLRIGKRIGSGSYGTVHQGYFIRSKDDFQPCIAKRAWTLAELESNVPQQISQSEKEQKGRQLAVAQQTGLAVAQRTGLVAAASPTTVMDDDVSNNNNLSPSEIKTRAERCTHYFDVEKHCFQKMEDKNNNDDGESKRAAPEFFGVYEDDGNGDSELTIEGYGDSDGSKWMVSEFVGSVNEPSQTLLDAMELDWKEQHSGMGNHQLYGIQKAMNLPESSTFGDTLDAIFVSLLENLKEIHDCNIVHRDVKPGNLLCDGSKQCLRLIDFGSAADLDPSPIPAGEGNALENLLSGGTRRVGYDEGITAVSPVYCAPEVFINPDESPLTFDVFSTGLVMSQLIFNLLDERTDAGFLQQLKEVDYDLDSWLEKELGATLRPSGFAEGLGYLGERRGMWGLLKRCFEKDPINRISSSNALERLNKIIGLQNGDIEWTDDNILEVAREESYFETVIESFESCAVHYVKPRPLHFLASFKKGIPVGLLLAEASEVENDGNMSSEDWEKWKLATQQALPGEVYVRGWEPGSQAGQLGIFEIGDRLRGVGELPFVDSGFEQAINLINRQPKGGQSLKLHFDRMARPKIPSKSDQSKNDHAVRVAGQGTWKSGGRRGNQEDSFALHEIKNDKLGDILLAGVFDGHAGTAASETCQGLLPTLFTTQLMAVCDSAMDDATKIQQALEDAWEVTCDTYRNGCDENGECIADYDPAEGILYAATGSTTWVAGTTATMVAISMNPQGTNDLTILNCGDSRTLVVGEPTGDAGSNSYVVFETRDHSPDDELEIERLQRGQELGLDYSIPICSMTSGSYVVVGDYQYALCRSLEGSYVTSKGIVSDPDVTTLSLSNSLADRKQDSCSLVLACDGLFEVMSNEEVGREVVRMRYEGYKPGDIAKNLCGQALKKGSYDNLSVVVVFLDDV